jgi:hypothetical protein
MIPVFQRVKTVHALDRAAILIGHEAPLFDLKVVIWCVVTALPIIGLRIFHETNSERYMRVILSPFFGQMTELIRTFYTSK